MGLDLEVPVGPKRFGYCWERWFSRIGGGKEVQQDGVHGVGLGCFC